MRELVEQERVASTDDAAGRAEQAGGRTLVPSTEISIGRFAVIADPQGAMLCLFEGDTDP
jgi:predicted enzyme related to lactoylglutathione lyase